jgi:ribose 5-phosphate isomerase RpiB
MMRVGIAADHGGFKLKGLLVESLCDSGYQGARSFVKSWNDLMAGIASKSETLK